MDTLRQAVAERLMADIDLVAHDVTNERRDSHGRWAETLGPAKMAELNAAGASALGTAKGPAKEFGDFKSQQAIAQRVADKAYRHNEVADGQSLYDNPDVLVEMKPCPERSWGVYQMDGGYQAINDELRDQAPQMQGTLMAAQLNTTRKQLADDMVKAFDAMGYTTQKPGVLYRTVDGDHFPLADMKPGTIYQDTGVISTSADRMEIAGLLDPPVAAFGQDVDMRRHDPILLKINVPAGTRVLGGSPGGIETMMKPGTKFRVVEVKSRQAIGGNGVKGYVGYIGKHTLPMVTLEVLG